MGPAGVAFKATTIVSPGATPADSGANLAAALAAAPTPCAIFIEPGDYDIGATALHLPSNCTVAGAGVGKTTLEHTGGGGVVLYLNTTLRDVSLRFDYGSGIATVVAADLTQPSAALQDVSIQVTDGAATSEPLVRGSGTLFHVDATTSTGSRGNFGVSVPADGKMTLVDCTVQAGSAIIVGTKGEAIIRGSVLDGGVAISNIASQTVIHVADSEIQGTILGSSTSTPPTCVGTYDAAFTALGTHCA